MSGRQKRPFAGVPRRQQVSVRQPHRLRMSGGRIAEHWMRQENPALLTQLGVTSEDPLTSG